MVLEQGVNLNGPRYLEKPYDNLAIVLTSVKQNYFNKTVYRSMPVDMFRYGLMTAINYIQD